MRPVNWTNVASALADDGISLVNAFTPRLLGAGNIGTAWRLQAKDGPLFLKTSKASALDMFDAEACGLAELAGTKTVRVPKVLAVTRTDDVALIALEWLEFGLSDAATSAHLGQQLADLHRHTQEQYGWHRDNYLGLTLQPNQYTDNWLGFFRERRLEYQLRLASENGYLGELQSSGQLLLDKLDVFFTGYTPAPSLLHGDLWGGNYAVADGQPVIFDPAVYFGDRETDLAMTRLFGGFSSEFYEAYDATWPLADGYELRVALYQLYHVLNHLNLFGGGYLNRAVLLVKNLSAI